MTTKKDWALFLLAIAFVIFLAIATFVILTGPDGHIPPRSPLPPHMTLLHT